MTVLQAAEEVGMTEDGIRAAMYRKKLPYRVVFGRQVIAREDLENYRATVKMGRPKKEDYPSK